ncbi:hypothetical protein NQ176_g4059 [Zarea fungicola]|uniref:Uncharacterized protein n=1 Tax=Zarea fungicola TaxID=93591 RepID=A0ACC1NG32_9HYPO|nr:hypothetical protein NQ176_g4059 [Lecanicillium fungicola]
MRSPLLILLAMPFELAQADSGQCGAQHGGVNGLDGCWKQSYWDGLWAIRQNACNQFLQAPSNDRMIRDWSSFAGHGQMTLQPGMTNSRCWDAFWDIIWRCFDSARAGTIGNGVTHETGQWTTDVTEKEWYWLWGNTGNGWCTTCSHGCKKRSLDEGPMKRYSPAEWEAARQISAEEQAAIDAGLATDHRKRLNVTSDQE